MFPSDRVPARTPGAAPSRGGIARVLLLCLAALLLLAGAVLAALTWGPHWQRERIAAAASERIGRTVSIGAIEVRPFAQRAAVTDLRIGGAGPEAAPLLELARGTVTLDLVAALRKRLVVREVLLESPRVALARVAPNRLDVADITERFAGPPSPEAGWPWRVARLEVRDGRVALDDRVVSHQWALETIALSLVDLGNEPERRTDPAGLEATFAVNGRPASLSASGTPFAEPPAGEARGKIDALPIAEALPYVALPRDVRPVRGTASIAAAARVRGVPGSRPDSLTVEGTLALDGLAVVDAAGTSRLAADSVTIALAPSQPLAGGNVHVGQLSVQAPVVALARGPDGALDWPVAGAAGGAAPQATATATESPGAPATPRAAAAAPAALPSLRVDAIRVADGRLDWRDASLPAPLATTLERIAIAVDGLVIDDLHAPQTARGTAKLEAVLDATAPVVAEATLEGRTGQASAGITQVDLPRYAPLAGPALRATVAQGRAEAGARLHWTFADPAGAQAAAPAAPAVAWRLADGRLGLADLKIVYGTRPPATLAALNVEAVQLDPAARRATVGRVRVDKAAIATHRRRDGRLDLQDWWVPVDTTRAAPGDARVPVGSAAAPGPAWQVDVARIEMADSTLEYTDDAIPANRRLPRVTVNANATGVSLDPSRPIPLEGTIALADGSRLGVRGTVRPQPLAVDTQLRLQRFSLRWFDPYLEPYVNLSVASGELWGGGRLTLTGIATEPLGRFTFDGELSGNDFRSVDRISGDDFLRFQALAMPSVKVDWRPAQLSKSLIEIGQVAFVDFYARMILDRQGRLNLRYVMVDPQAGGRRSLTDADLPPEPVRARPGSASGAAGPSVGEGETGGANRVGGPVDGGRGATQLASTRPADGPTIRIGTVRIASGSIDFTDLFIQPNYSANLTRLVGSIDAIASDRTEPSDLLITGRVDDDTPLEITGKINPLAPLRFVDLRATARGYDLPKLSTYSGRWAGYAIEKGKLTANVRYQIEGDRLQGENKLVINQLTFGPKVASPDAPNLPVQLAISLLKDRDGNIDLDVPISGTITDPQFSVGALIWRAIGNLVVKAVTSPFTLLASASGAAGADLSHIEFAAGGATLDDEDRKRLDGLARALTERPALTIEIAGYADDTADRRALEQRQLEQTLRAAKLAQMKRENPRAELPAARDLTIDAAERPALLERAWRDAKLDAGGAKVPGPEELERLLIAHSPVPAEDVKQVAQQRAQVARDYLRDTRGIDQERLYLLAPRIAPAGDTPTPHRTAFAVK